MTIPEYMAVVDFWNEAHGGASQGNELTTKAADEMVTKLRGVIDKQDPEKRKKALASLLAKKKLQPAKGKVPRVRHPR